MPKTKAKIVYNKKVSGKYFHLSLRAPIVAKEALPGQFVNIRVSDTQEPILRRPFSIHDSGAFDIEILYEVKGQGTQILAKKKPGEYLDIIGPLGNGFDYSTPVPQYPSTPVLVAGGMGVAPLVFLQEKLKEIPNPKSQIPNIVLIGARTEDAILCEKEFKKLGCDVKIATDNGSRGFKGKVTDLLKSLLSTVDCRLSTIYACGPKPMLKEISRVSLKYKIPAQVSLEEHMACGIGACLGCVVKVKSKKKKGKSEFEYKRACKEGPVFKAEEITW